MTTVPPNQAPPEREPQPRAWSWPGEVGWWLVLGVLVTMDVAGFITNMQLLLADQPDYVSAIAVLACTVVSVLLPWRFGTALEARRARTSSGMSVIVPSLILWAGLAALMFWIRIHYSAFAAAGPDSSATGLAPTIGRGPATVPAAVSGDSKALIFALLLLTLYCVTGLMSAEHAYSRGRRSTARVLARRRSTLLRMRRREQQEADKEAALGPLLQKKRDRLEKAQALGVEAEKALSDVTRAEALLEMARALGDPSATERLIVQQRRLQEGTG